ncbi:MAG: RagB/SusD family nutrient uptake outer membrane protein [Tannerella sp.]|nr:RagB/SusD family nutrient uptake outer membrane protein [Tannerella sp.]
MKKTIYKVLIMTVLAGTTACTDILDTAPYNSVASGNMWTNEALTNQGVAGVYEAMRSWGVYGASSYGIPVVPFECLGFSGEAYRSIAYLNGGAGPGDTFFSTMWSKFYEGVHRANDAIAHLPEAQGVDDESKARLLAECKFMRAYYYTRLNELYGRYGLGVPLYTEPIGTVEDCDKGQSSESEVWAQIEKDLTDCINEPAFPNRYTERGRACKGAAYALRGRAYLMQGARYEYNNASGKVEKTTIDNSLLQKACADFDKVAGCGFGLFQGGYRELFTEANEGCNEMIFSVQNYSKPDYGSRMQLMAGTRSAGDKSGGTGYSQYSVSPALVDLYEKTDGTPFDWDDYIPGYNSTSVQNRIVYFLRDTEDKNGNKVNAEIISWVNNKLPAEVKDLYLPYGNEARLTAAYSNRDPRLLYNVIVPYSEYVGMDANYAKAGNMTPVVYSYRWPVKTASHSVDAQKSLGIVSPFDLQQDGNGNAEFAYRHRKFVMEGYDCEYRNDMPIDEPVLRYAYVLMMWAEALAQQGDLAGAAAKVNMVRSRKSVEMPDYTFTSKEDAMTKIQNESRREFVNEGVNFYEEMRWGTLRAVKYSKYGIYDPAAHMCTGQQSNGNGTVAWSSTNDYSIWPVPSVEIEKNKNLSKTPGWQY